MSVALLTESTLSPLRLIFRHRALIKAMARREITDRYAGQMLGVVWAFAFPLIQISIFILVFRFIFRVKVGGTIDMPLDYTTYLLAGLLPWMAFAESMSKGSVAILGHVNLVKQVVFPLEVLPVKGAVSSMLIQVVGTSFMIFYVLAVWGGLPWTYCLLPVLMAFQLIAMMGASFLLSALGAYIRDIKDVIAVFCIVGVYMMPTFYLPKWMPTLLRPLLYVNPFSYMIWCYQDVCYYGRFEHPWAWPVFIFGSIAIFYIGFRVFGKLKTHFGSVL